MTFESSLTLALLSYILFNQESKTLIVGQLLSIGWLISNIGWLIVTIARFLSMHH